MNIFTDKLVDATPVLADDHLVPVAEGVLEDRRRRLVVDVEKHRHVVVRCFGYVWLKKEISLFLAKFTKSNVVNLIPHEFC